MKQKLFTILTLLLCLCSTAWADDQLLVSVDFTNTTNFPAATYGSTDEDTQQTVNGVFIYTKKGSKYIKINNTTAGVDFCGQNMDSSGKHGLAIPVTGVNGKLVVKVNHNYNNTSASFKVGIAHATDNDPSKSQTFDLSPTNSGTKNKNDFTITKTGLTGTDYIVWVGENGSSYNVLQSIEIYTAESTGKANPNLTVSPASVTLAKDGTQQLTPSQSGNGAISYETSNSNVATVSNTGLVTAVGYGSATITVTSAETDGYNEGSTTMNVIVKEDINVQKNAKFNNGLTCSPEGFATISGAINYNGNYTGTYGGDSYTKGLKMQSDTEINFTTTSASCDLIVVQSTNTNVNNFKIDNVAFATNYDTKYYYDEPANKVRVHVYKGLTAGNHSIIRAESKELGILYVGVTEAPAPSLSVSPTSASAFAYAEDNGPSAAQTFTVTGSNLTGTITATLSNTTNYEMRTGDGEFGAGPLTDLASGTAVQVRLKAGLAKGDSYNGNLTFSSTGADNKVVALTGSVTGQKYAITEGTHTNGNITIDKEEATEGETVTLTATPNVRYLFDSWSVYKTGEPTTTVTVTDNQFTMPAYAVTVDATFTADPKKQVLYLTSNGTVNDNDKLYAALAEDYTVTKAAFDATKTVTDFDLVVFHESIGGGNYNKNLVDAAIKADVPVLNTKSYFYGADKDATKRWTWGAPNEGTSVAGATINPAYGNIASHPIFEGVDISDAGFVTLFNAATAKAMQPVTALASGKEGYTLAITPNVAAVGGNGVAIHELSATQRGLTSGSAKYLMVSIGDGNGCFEKLTTNGQKLLKNAAAYLIDNTASWTPTTSVSGTITASGWNTFSSYAALDLFKIDGGAAYVASAVSGNSVTLTPVTDKIVAAGTGLMIKGTAGEAFTINTTADAATFSGDNLLVGLPNGGEVAKANNTDTWNYVFGWTDPTDPGFYLVNATLPTLGAGKAYLQTSAALSTETPARLNLVFEGAATGINGIEEVAPVTKTRKVVKNGRLVIETANGEFTVSGARVK